MRRVVQISLCCAVFYFAAESAQAQLTPDEQAVAQERKARDRETQQRAQAEAGAEVRLQAPMAKAKSRLPEAEQPCFPINVVSISGEDSQRFLWLTSYLGMEKSFSSSLSDTEDSPIGRCIGVQGVQTIIDRLQNALVSRGYVTTRIIASSDQNLQSGTLALTVLPGKVGIVRWRSANAGSTSLWNAVPLRPDDILTLWDVEQALENLRRVPTGEADIEIVPSAQAASQSNTAGYSDLIISRTQKFPLRLNVSADDSGSPATGLYQSSITLSFDNPLRLNDLFYVALNRDLGGGATGERGTRGFTVHYSMPIGYWTLGATSSQSRYHQTVAGSTQDYIYQGTSENNEIKASYILSRNGSGKISVAVKAFQRKSNNFIDDTEVKVQRRVIGGYEFSIDYKGDLGRVAIDAGLNHKRGTGDFGSIPAPEEAFGEGTSRMKLLTTYLNVGAPFSVFETPLN